MCRILWVRGAEPFDIAGQLRPFAELSRLSKEYQGHGWGMAYKKIPSVSPSSKGSALQSDSGLAGGPPPLKKGERGGFKPSDKWHQYHNISPIWEDDLSQFVNLKTSLLLVHARSAFRDEGIAVENNMPFSDGDSVFIFNGELRGVKIKSEGRIGAEKIYNYIRRMDKGDKQQALDKAVGIIKRRTEYIRAMNILMSDGETSLLSSDYSEDPDYFQMYRKQADGMEWVCSQPFLGESDWQRIANGTLALLTSRTTYFASTGEQHEFNRT